MKLHHWRSSSIGNQSSPLNTLSGITHTNLQGCVLKFLQWQTSHIVSEEPQSSLPRFDSLLWFMCDSGKIAINNMPHENTLQNLTNSSNVSIHDSAIAV